MKLRNVTALAFLGLVTLTPSTSAASRCPLDLCRGDQVVSGSGYVGKVLGVNPHKKDVSVRWTTKSNGYSTNSRSTMDFEDLYISKGCLKKFCIGRGVTSESGYEGKIIGINFNKDRIAVKWTVKSNGYSTNSRSTLDRGELLLKKGCVKRYCIGDRVMSNSGYEGEILALNKRKKRATMKWTVKSNGYSTNSRSTVSIKDLSLAKGCFNGLCIGDDVISPSGYEGRVKGINRFKNRAGIHWTRKSNGYSTNSRSTMDIEELSISHYCLDFSDNQRYADAYDNNYDDVIDVISDDQDYDQDQNEAQFYVVQSGDTLFAIAIKFGLSLRDISELNIDLLANIHNIRVGMRIRIK